MQTAMNPTSSSFESGIHRYEKAWNRYHRAGIKLDPIVDSIGKQTGRWVIFTLLSSTILLLIIVELYYSCLNDDSEDIILNFFYMIMGYLSRLDFRPITFSAYQIADDTTGKWS